MLLTVRGVPDLTSSGQARETAQRLGRAIGAERAETFLRRLLLAQQQLDQNANPRLTLEVLALDMPVPAARAR
jgi:hypothetical protein